MADRDNSALESGATSDGGANGCQAAGVAVKEVRVAKAKELLGHGVPTSSVAAQLVEQFGIGERSAWRDIAQARDEFRRAAGELDAKSYLPRAIEIAERHYVRCLKESDLGTGLRTLQWIAQLNNIAPVASGQQTNVNVLAQGGQVAVAAQLQERARRMSDEELQARLAELRRKQLTDGEHGPDIIEAEAASYPKHESPAEQTGKKEQR